MSPNLSLEPAFTTVLKHYDCLAESDEFDADSIAQVKAALKEVWGQKKRFASPQSVSCISKFVTTENDFSTPGLRGMGRLSETPPRFAAKHKSQYEKMPAHGRLQIAKAIEDHLWCGYLFSDMIFDAQPIRHDKYSVETIQSDWLNRIYTDLSALDPRSEREWELMDTWFAATGKVLREACVSFGIKWNHVDEVNSELHIISKYFDAGRVLRLLDAKYST